MFGVLKKEKLLNSINLINEIINIFSVLVFKIKMYFLWLFFLKFCYLKKCKKKNFKCFNILISDLNWFILVYK